MSNRRKSQYILSAVIICAIGAYIGIYMWKQEHRPHILDVYVFALKSGRSIFIRTPTDVRILIDGGGNSEVVREITKILPFYTRRIDTIIATDSDGKNVSGLIDVLGRYNVGRVFIPALTLQSLGLSSSTDGIYDTFIQSAKSANIKMEEISEGAIIDLGLELTSEPVQADIQRGVTGSHANVIGKTIFPARREDFTYSKASAPELLFDIEYSNTSFMLQGGASVKVQKYIAGKMASSSSAVVGDTRNPGAHRDQSVLIVSHSALPANISTKLIEQLKPKYLVYSKSLTAVSKSATPSKSSKKVATDPLQYLPLQNRLNIKKEGTTHFVSDGTEIRVVR